MSFPIRLLFPVVVMTLLAGCLWPWGHCGPYYDGANWSEPGLFAVIGEAPMIAHSSLEDFVHPDLDERWPAGYALQTIRWEPPSAAYGAAGEGRGEHHHGELFQVSLSLAPPGRGAEPSAGTAEQPPFLSLLGEETVADEDWANITQTFLGALGANGTTDAWIDGLLAERTAVGYTFIGETETALLSVTRSLDMPLDLEGHYDGLGEAEETGVHDPARTTLRWTGATNGTWTYVFDLAVKTVQLDGDDDRSAMVRVGADDRVLADISGDFDSTEEVQAWLADAFVAAGLPAPTFADFDVQVSVC